ncbi:MAG: energy-coupling factor transporter transmembrane protein EcfT [Propionibacteriaceae bacterium]|nr:energy-coupling factor transporter transmembrane protein EcfT [Propionibacteriaceae bacterium]
MLSLYLTGHTLVHRVPAGVKLGLLALMGTAAMLVTAWPALAAGLLAVIGLYGVARLPPGAVWRSLRSVLAIVAVIIACQWLLTSAATALVVGLRILILIAAANLVTWTTPMSNLIATVERLLAPLTRFGVHPERVGLALALTLHFIPVLAERGARIREAQAARGVRARFTYLVPLIISTVRMADGVGEALEVRGTLAPVPASQ